MENVKSKVDISSVIGKYIKLNSKAKALCPFHKEKTPSFSVNRKDGYFYCFGCGAGGDVIKFIEMYKSVSFSEALKELSIATGIGLPNFSKEYKEKIKEERLVEDILNKTAGFYHNNINKEAEDYFLDDPFAVIYGDRNNIVLIGDLTLLGPAIGDVFEDIVYELESAGGGLPDTPMYEEETGTGEMAEVMGLVRDMADMFNSMSVSSTLDGDTATVRVVLTMND